MEKSSFIDAPTIADDDIFARPPRALARQMAQTARRQCRVCDGSYVVALSSDAPALCDGCRADIPATRARVLAWIHGVQDQELAALDVWDVERAKAPSWWERIQDAREAQRPDCDTKARRAHPTYAALLDAEAAYHSALVPLVAERSRLERALEEIDGR